MRQLFVFYVTVFLTLLSLFFFPSQSKALSCVQPLPVEKYLTGQERTLDSFVIAQVLDHNSDDDLWLIKITITLVGPYLAGEISAVDKDAQYGPLDLKKGQIYLLQIEHKDEEQFLATCSARILVDSKKTAYYQNQVPLEIRSNPRSVPQDKGEDLSSQEVLLAVVFASFVILAIFLLIAKIQNQEDEIEDKIEHMPVEIDQSEDSE